MQCMMNAGSWGGGREKRREKWTRDWVICHNCGFLSLLKTTEFLLFLPILFYRFMIGIQYIT